MKDIEMMQDLAEQLYAIELLEYHNLKLLRKKKLENQEIKLWLIKELLKLTEKNGGIENREEL